MSLDKTYRISDFPLDEKTLMLQETLFHNANGYLGVRGNLEENVPDSFVTMRGTYINGFYDVVPMKQSESLCNLVEEKDTMLNIADTQTVKIVIDGEEFSLFRGKVLSLNRTLDMAAGTTRRTVRWRSPKGNTLSLSFTRMASFVRKNVFTVECEVRPEDFSGTVEVRSYHIGLVKNYSNPNDPRLAADGGVLLNAEGHRLCGTTTYLTSRTSKSGLTVCTAVCHEFSVDGTQVIGYDEQSHSYETSFACALNAGETLSFVKYTVTTDSLRCSDCMCEAETLMDSSFGRVGEMYREQREYLDDFWLHTETEIDSDDDSSFAVAFIQYELLQSCGSDGLCAVASKGLSGEGYEGHYFWDTEIYLMPFFSYTNPGLTRNLLRYRYTALGLAKENARLLGHTKGALFPWRTISGRECSGYFPAGSAQYHINADIAYAAVQYYLITGDLDYLADEGAEILIETARLWIDTGNYSHGRFVINDVTGPDEYTCIVNNNYYTNAGAAFNLRWAVHALKLLRDNGMASKAEAATQVTEAELSEFAAAAKAMYLPYDVETGINPQDDSFLQKPVWDFAATPKENYPLLLHYHPLCLYRHQVCKQADTVLAYFLFGGIESYETQLRSFEYYEKLTTHDSSLSNCIFSIMASRLGLREKAWQYFGDSIKSDLNNSHGNTGDGIHTANMGGSYMMIVNGFAGMNVSEAGLELRPFVPEAWRGYRFRISFRKSFLEVNVTKNGCTVRLLNDIPVTLRLYETEYSLSPEKAEIEVKR